MAVSTQSHTPQQRSPQRERVWITWETQRRSTNLSRKLGAELVAFNHDDLGFFRYPLSAIKTLAVLWKYRRKVVFVQFPSIFLAALAGFLRPLFRYYLVVDRHTDFSMDLSPPFGWRDRLIIALSAYTLRKADLTVVTNPEVAPRFPASPRRIFVLPDPFPDLPLSPWHPPSVPLEILFVSTWAEDEPILEVMEACRILIGRVKVHVSGKMKKKFASEVLNAPPNFIPTGFLSDIDYFSLMSRVDCVMAITTRPATLVCGAYEAISMGKPLLLGDTPVLREYFDAGALYTSGTAADISEKLKELPARLPALRAEILRFYERSRAAWELRFSELNRILKEHELQ